MANQKSTREYVASYIKDLLSAEKDLFSLKLVRDSIQTEYDSCLHVASNAPVENEPEPPKAVEYKLKRVPEKPVLNSKNKMIKLSELILQISVISCIVLFVDFVAVLIATGFFSKSFSESGAWGTLLIILMILTIASLVGSVAIRIVETVRLKEDYKSWLAIKSQIEEHNREEIKKADELSKQQNEQYNKDLEQINAKRIENSLGAKVKADIFELQKAKISSSILSAEKNIAMLYSADIVPPAYRRIDIIFMLDKYFDNNLADDIDGALKLYNNDVESGVAAAYLSDIFEEEEKFQQSMPEFIELIALMREETENIMSDASEMAASISKKAINIEKGTVNANIIAMEFQRLYNESMLARFSGRITEQSKLLTEKYSAEA